MVIRYMKELWDMFGIREILVWRCLSISENRFSGTLPNSLVNLSGLAYPIFGGNNFGGEVPRFDKLHNLYDLGMDNNQFCSTGKPDDDLSFMSSLTNATNLNHLYLQNNAFGGTIVNLTMKRNLFHGLIPSTFSSLRSLQVLDLSHNKLSGALPERGIFENVSVVSLVGNPRVCGGVLDLKLPNCNFSRSKKLNFKLVIPVIFGILGLVVMVGSFFVYQFERSTRTFPSLDKDLNQLLTMSYQSILKVTNGFSANNLIGVGIHGFVYKGIFETDGKHVAIKVLDLLQHVALKSFIAECEALRNVRHRNLVKLLIACSGVDYGGNEFKALVYEFMANGSLDDWLHPDNSRANVQPRRLGFMQRLYIAIDVASAIDYLHNDCQLSIVHYDLKPNNILLDDELVAHVGNFGLSRFLHLTDQITCRIHTSSHTFKGSIDYIAPEYGTGSEPSTHGDVYSVGIVLLEMLTGKRPTDDMFGGDLSLDAFVKNAMPDGALEIVDPDLNLEDEEQSRESSRIPSLTRRQKIAGGLISLLEVEVVCSMYDSDENHPLQSTGTDRLLKAHVFRQITPHICCSVLVF
ncbi:probable LRR receptor-like serine/threonine-protein kinase At3g47570 [Lycium ferocissimum]|uniref:probable LRR receptor-like serine/threonine-protein kinase At3g47570 n=1 Tax=Lycium ferocissimum TaxID=112874 RepID=UPI002815727F|nr:probable LRR receptor-like serine/threonine-protein kinase At3g47570 [Lycium ferocissimum]